MKFALVGIGAAGGRIVDRIRTHEASHARTFASGDAFVFDTSPDSFAEYDAVSADRQVLMGDTHPDIDAEGTGGDIDLGAAIAREESNEIYREFDEMDTNALDAILLVAGLGGGTGGGTGAVMLEHLQAIYELPVYAIGVLPHGEDRGELLNAARSLQSFVSEADNVLLFDNDAWHSGESPVEESYAAMNRELATRIVSTFATATLDGTAVAESRIDSSDIMRTLDTGGVSSIGYASTELEREWGLVAWLRSLFGSDDTDQETDAAKTKALIRRAVTSRLTLPCEVSSAERGLIVLSGPPSVCSRRGFESARYWLEGEADTVEVLAGDDPREDATTLTATVLLSNVTDVPRVEELQSRAVDST